MLFILLNYYNKNIIIYLYTYIKMFMLYILLIIYIYLKNNYINAIKFQSIKNKYEYLKK